MYAIIKTGGKQYRVEQDTIIKTALLPLSKDADFETDQVLLVKESDDKFKIGDPLVNGAKVMGKVIDHFKAKKVIVFKKKRRKGYQRKAGHRQDYTKIKITGIQV